MKYNSHVMKNYSHVMKNYSHVMKYNSHVMRITIIGMVAKVRCKNSIQSSSRLYRLDRFDIADNRLAAIG